MFGFFKKKGEAPEKPIQNMESRQFKELAAQFRPEELTILAVTGANGFNGNRAGKDKG